MSDLRDIDLPAPRRNPELIGHGAPERAMLEAALSGRLPHAWLIGGPPGIGKATLAFRFARFVLSGAADQGGGLFNEVPTDLHVDPEHPTFRRIASGGHADLLTIERLSSFEEEAGDDKAGRKKVPKELPVDQVRRIAPFLRLTPAEGGWRVVVVDEAEKMNRNSANAILKVLEEPPARSLILLVSNNPGALLPTIRSRCRRLTLEPLPEAEIAACLARIATDLGEADRLALARLAEGSIGRAVALLREGGLDLYRGLIGLLDTLPRLDLSEVHQLSDRLGGAAGEGTYRVATGLLLWWLERLVRAIARGTLPAEVTAGEAALMQRLAAAHGLERWMEVWDNTTHIFAQADTANLDRKQVVLRAFLSLKEATARG